MISSPSCYLTCFSVPCIFSDLLKLEFWSDSNLNVFFFLVNATSYAGCVFSLNTQSLVVSLFDIIGDIIGL